MDNIFDKAVKKIEITYEELGFRDYDSIRPDYQDIGWVFLLSPKRTLAPSTKLMFVGINPGSAPRSEISDDQLYEPSCEGGNAFRHDVQQWAHAGPRHQQEVEEMFKRLSNRLSSFGDGTSWEDLMDATLTSNFCPFRSPSGNWKDMPNKKEAIRFSYELWSEILLSLEPRVVICNGIVAFKYFCKLFKIQGFDKSKCPSFSTGWGIPPNDTKYYMSKGGAPYGAIDIIGLPHLSRFKIFTREECKEKMDPLLKHIAGFIYDDKDRKKIMS